MLNRLLPYHIYQYPKADLEVNKMPQEAKDLATIEIFKSQKALFERFAEVSKRMIKVRTNNAIVKGNNVLLTFSLLLEWWYQTITDFNWTATFSGSTTAAYRRTSKSCGRAGCRAATRDAEITCGTTCSDRRCSSSGCNDGRRGKQYTFFFWNVQ